MQYLSAGRVTKRLLAFVLAVSLSLFPLSLDSPASVHFVSDARATVFNQMNFKTEIAVLHRVSQKECKCRARSTRFRQWP